MANHELLDANLSPLMPVQDRSQQEISKQQREIQSVVYKQTFVYAMATGPDPETSQWPFLPGFQAASPSTDHPG